MLVSPSSSHSFCSCTRTWPALNCRLALAAAECGVALGSAGDPANTARAPLIIGSIFAGRSLAAGQLGAARARRSGLLCYSKGCRRCTSRDWASRNVAIAPAVGGEAPWLRVAVRVAAVVRGQAAQRLRRVLGRQAAQRVRRGEGLVERPCRALRACSSACTGRVGFLRTASLLASRARPAYSSVLVWFELLPHRLQYCSACRCRWRHCRSSSRSPSLPPSRGEGWRVPST